MQPETQRQRIFLINVLSQFNLQKNKIESVPLNDINFVSIREKMGNKTSTDARGCGDAEKF